MQLVDILHIQPNDCFDLFRLLSLSFYFLLYFSTRASVNHFNVSKTLYLLMISRFPSIEALKSLDFDQNNSTDTNDSTSSMNEVEVQHLKQEVLVLQVREVVEDRPVLASRINRSDNRAIHPESASKIQLLDLIVQKLE